MTVLMLLFMFQGIWNVAAAFCAHESVIDVTTSETTHFGHHQGQSCDATSDSQKQKQQVFTDTANTVSVDGLPSFLDEHHDHLPSFSHFIVMDDYAGTGQALFNHYIQKKLFAWESLYQSPHLSSLNPPPEFMPLFAG